MAEEHGPTTHHQPEKAGGPETKGMLSGNKKWYLIGGVAVIGLLVLVFVRKSNANASTSGTNSAAQTTLDPTTMAMLQAALQNAGSSGISSGLPGAQGPPGATGQPGPPGPSGGGTNAAGGGAVTVNIPNEGGWLPVTFPNAAALQQFYQFAGVTSNNGYYPSNGDVNRQAWINELNTLGATGYPQSLTSSPNTAVPNTAPR